MATQAPLAPKLTRKQITHHNAKEIAAGKLNYSSLSASSSSSRLKSLNDNGAEFDDEFMVNPSIPDNIRQLLKPFDKDSQENLYVQCKQPNQEQEDEQCAIDSIQTLYNANNSNRPTVKQSSENLETLKLQKQRQIPEYENPANILSTDREKTLKEFFRLNSVQFDPRNEDGQQLTSLTQEIDALHGATKKIKMIMLVVESTFSNPTQTKSGVTVLQLDLWKWILIGCISNLAPAPYERAAIENHLKKKLKDTKSFCKMIFKKVAKLQGDLKGYKSKFDKMLVQLCQQDYFHDDVFAAVKSSKIDEEDEEAEAGGSQSLTTRNSTIPAVRSKFSLQKNWESGDDGREMELNILELSYPNQLIVKHFRLGKDQLILNYKDCFPHTKCRIFEEILRDIVSTCFTLWTEQLAEHPTLLHVNHVADLKQLLKITPRTKHIVETLIINQLLTIQSSLGEILTVSSEVASSFQNLYRMISKLRKEFRPIMNGKRKSKHKELENGLKDGENISYGFSTTGEGEKI